MQFLKCVYLVWTKMQQCGMIALKSMLAERTHVFFHTSKYMRKNLVCWQQSLSCTACHYKSRMHKLYSEVNTCSRGQKTVCSKCSHPCRTTRYNDGKHKVATHSAHNKHTSPKSKRDAKDIQPGCHNYFSVHD